MRISALARCLPLLLALASPTLLRAQFQQPTDEELKMTSDPKAPGAAAVYLYREETSDDFTHFHRFYVRIKVLQEKGKELATVNVPYRNGRNKVTDIRGRTIHADGTIIPLVVKPDDLVDFKIKGLQVNSVVFTLPSVEVGSILEYRYSIFNQSVTSELTWWIQQPYFVRKAHYSFHYDNHLFTFLYAYCLPSESRLALENLDTQTLDITDVPPQPDEEWMPPLNTLRWNVEFYISPFNNIKDFWNNAGKEWAEEVKDFTNPTGGIKKLVADIIAPADTDEQKARKIYAAVQKLNNTAFSREKTRAERKQEKLKDIRKAEDVWKQRGGTDDEITLLYVALARAAGLRIWPMLVVDRNRAIFDNTYLTTRQFDDYLAIVVLDGKEIYLDPGQKMCPFGVLHWKHTLATGLRLAGKSAVIASTPGNVYKGDALIRVTTLNIDESGNVKGNVRFVMSGQEALYWRQLALENDEIEVKKQFNESMLYSLPEGVQADFDHFLALDDYSVNLMAIVNVSGNIGAVTGKHLLLPGLLFESRARHPFVALDKRVFPIDVHYPRIEQDEVTYNLPSGFNADSLPQDDNVAWPDHAVLKIHFSAMDGSAKIMRLLAYNYTLLDPRDYNDLHDFYLKVAAADQVQLVLSKSPAVPVPAAPAPPAPKGN
jgi:hypothetical protein